MEEVKLMLDKVQNGPRWYNLPSYIFDLLSKFGRGKNLPPQLSSAGCGLKLDGEYFGILHFRYIMTHALAKIRTLAIRFEWAGCSKYVEGSLCLACLVVNGSWPRRFVSFHARRIDELRAMHSLRQWHTLYSFWSSWK